MNSLFLNDKVKLICLEDKFLLFSLAGKKILSVNKDFLRGLNDCETPEQLEQKHPDIYSPLQEIGIFEKDNLSFGSREGKPTTLCIFPTSDCNLACIYCYADAGKKVYDIDPVIAKKGIDYIVSNALEKDSDSIEFGFHGGGEPLLGRVFGNITDLVEYVKSRASETGIQAIISTITNGFLTLDKVEWIIENVDALTISIDGPEDIQNKQRPTRSGKASYDTVMRTVDLLRAKDFPFSVRSTITGLSTGRIKEIYTHFRDLGVTNIILEPLGLVGNAVTNSIPPVDQEKFIKEYLDVRRLAISDGIQVASSMSKLNVHSCVFCGAAGSPDEGPNFCITPQGYVSACYEVTLKEDPRSKDFFYGKFNHDKQDFEFYDDIIKKLLSRSADNLPGCKDCIAQYSCAGDCLAKAAAQKGDYFSTVDNYRCNMIKDIFVKEMLEEFKSVEQK